LLQGRGRPDRRPPDGLRPDGTARPARRDPGRRRVDVDRLPAAGARPGRAPSARWSTGTGRSPPRSSRSTNRTASWRGTVGTVPGVYRGLADLVIGVHFAYLAVLVFGGLAAARWRKLLWWHLAAVVWALGALTVRYDCPLTSLEAWLRRLGGQRAVPDGFLRHYVRGVLFPDWSTPVVVAVAAVVVVAGWVRLAAKRPARNLWPAASTYCSTNSARAARISALRNRRCPPRVRMAEILPERAQRVTVFGLTRNSAATAEGVSSSSLSGMGSASSAGVVGYTLHRLRRRGPE